MTAAQRHNRFARNWVLQVLLSIKTIGECGAMDGVRANPALTMRRAATRLLLGRNLSAWLRRCRCDLGIALGHGTEAATTRGMHKLPLYRPREFGETAVHLRVFEDI